MLYFLYSTHDGTLTNIHCKKNLYHCIRQSYHVGGEAIFTSFLEGFIKWIVE